MDILPSLHVEGSDSVLEAPKRYRTTLQYVYCLKVRAPVASRLTHSSRRIISHRRLLICCHLNLAQDHDGSYPTLCALLRGDEQELSLG
jgi:hypothetical protein